jgi:hypothetical protein
MYCRLGEMQQMTDKFVALKIEVEWVYLVLVTLFVANKEPRLKFGYVIFVNLLKKLLKH